MGTGDVQRRQDSLAGLAAQVPPEAVIQLIDIIATIVRATAEAGASRQQFERELASLNAQDASYERRLAHLLELVDKTTLTDEARNKVVETICELSLK